jgi:hypothetical protein
MRHYLYWKCSKFSVMWKQIPYIFLALCLSLEGLTNFPHALTATFCLVNSSWYEGHRHNMLMQRRRRYFCLKAQDQGMQLWYGRTGCCQKDKYVLFVEQKLMEFHIIPSHSKSSSRETRSQMKNAVF